MDSVAPPKHQDDSINLSIRSNEKVNIFAEEIDSHVIMEDPFEVVD